MQSSKKPTPIQRLTYENYMLQLTCNELNQKINTLESKIIALNQYIDMSCNPSDTTTTMKAIVIKPPKPMVKDESKCFPYDRYGYYPYFSSLFDDDYYYYRGIDLSHNLHPTHRELPINPTHPPIHKKGIYDPYPIGYLPYPYYPDYPYRPDHPYYPGYPYYPPILPDYYYRGMDMSCNSQVKEIEDESKHWSPFYHRPHHHRPHHHHWRDINSLPPSSKESENSIDVIHFLQNKNAELQKIIMEQNKHNTNK